MIGPVACAGLAAVLHSAIWDVNGQSIPVSRNHRIVSIAPAITETLFALGAGGQIVAVSDYCDFPAQAKNRQRVGSLETLNVERVVSLKPTLILTAVGGPKEHWKRLSRLVKAPVFLVPNGGIEAIRKTVLQIGAIIGRVREASRLVGKIDATIAQVRGATRGRIRPTVFYMVWNDPLMTAGPGSYLDELIDIAGGRNLGREFKDLYPRMPWELLVAKPPDVVLGPQNLRAPLEHLAQKVRARRKATIDSNLASRPGPRVIEALWLLVAILQPAVAKRTRLPQKFNP